jgi:hypothetical protein
MELPSRGGFLQMDWIDPRDHVDHVDPITGRAPTPPPCATTWCAQAVRAELPMSPNFWISIALSAMATLLLAVTLF